MSSTTLSTSSNTPSIFLDSRVFTPPLTGIARVTTTIESAVQAAGIPVSHPEIRIPHKLQNIAWRTPVGRATTPIERVLNTADNHSTANIFHALWPFAPLPSSKTMKLVYTVHDLIPLHAEWKMEFSSKVRHQFEKDVQDALDRADHIHFVSEFTKRDTLSRFDLKDDPSRMSVIPLAIPEQWFTASSQTGAPTPTELDATLAHITQKGLTIDNSFFLVIGSVLPHKNIQWLVDLYDESFPPLLIVGAQTHTVTSNKSNVFTTGYLSDQSILWLYDNATALIFPSLHEGFGLPPLEAMARECPVIAGSSTSIPEVVGKAALQVDCRDAKEMHSVIDAVARSSKLRKELIARGAEHVRQFTPQKFAQLLLSMYTRVLLQE